MAPRLLDRLDAVQKWVVADRGYSSHPFRQHVRGIGAGPAVPCRADEEQVRCPDWIYPNRHRVEQLWARLEEWRAVATRYEKTATAFMGVCSASPLPATGSSDDRP